MSSPVEASAGESNGVEEVIDGGDGFGVVAERLRRRQEERNERLLRRKEANVDSQANQDCLHLFNQQFVQKQREIERSLKEADDVKESERDELFQRLSNDLCLLHRHLASTTSLLTSYDLRIFKDNLTDLEKSIAQTQTRLMPKKKFAFKKKRDRIIVEEKEVKECKDVEVKDTVDRGISLSGPGFHSRVDEKLVLREEEVDGREVTLSDLNGCTVIVRGCPCSVFVRRIRDTTLVLGPVSTSVLLYGAEQCTVTAWCHQMRIHDSTDSDFYVRVASDPVIENCRRVRFAPYNLHYNGMERHVRLSGLHPDNDKWNNIKDFDWLVPSHPSPYWSVIPPDLRRSNWPD